MGFEPTVRKTVHLISSQAHSTTLAPLRLLKLILAGAFSASTLDLIPRCARHPSGAPGFRVASKPGPVYRVKPIRPLWRRSGRGRHCSGVAAPGQTQMQVVPDVYPPTLGLWLVTGHPWPGLVTDGKKLVLHQCRHNASRLFDQILFQSEPISVVTPDLFREHQLNLQPKLPVRRGIGSHYIRVERSL